VGAATIRDPSERCIPHSRYGRIYRSALVSGALLALDLVFASFGPHSWRGGLSGASAHDNWIARGPYRSPRDGKHCCGENDCFPVHVEGITITPQGYWLSSGEQDPFEEALLSEDGSYWRCMNPDRSRRCFFAPPPGGV
jgi:hypothetical protein